MTEANKEMMQLLSFSFLEDFGHEHKQSVVLRCDGQSVIHLTNNHVYHARTKHIQV